MFKVIINSKVIELNNIHEVETYLRGYRDCFYNHVHNDDIQIWIEFPNGEKQLRIIHSLYCDTIETYDDKLRKEKQEAVRKMEYEKHIKRGIHSE